MRRFLGRAMGRIGRRIALWMFDEYMRDIMHEYMWRERELIGRLEQQRLKHAAMEAMLREMQEMEIERIERSPMTWIGPNPPRI